MKLLEVTCVIVALHLEDTCVIGQIRGGQVAAVVSACSYKSSDQILLRLVFLNADRKPSRLCLFWFGGAANMPFYVLSPCGCQSNYVGTKKGCAR